MARAGSSMWEPALACSKLSPATLCAELFVSKNGERGRLPGSGLDTFALSRRPVDSTHVGDAPLDVCLSRGFRLCGKLQDRCVLTLTQLSQENHLSVRKFESIMMHHRLILADLPKYCRRMVDHPLDTAARPRSPPALSGTLI
jgi:hypothetical protein